MLKYVTNTAKKLFDEFKCWWDRSRKRLVKSTGNIGKYLRELDRVQVIGIGLVLVGIFLASFPYIQNVYYQRMQQAELQRMQEEHSSNYETDNTFNEKLSVYYRNIEQNKSIEDDNAEKEDPVLEVENEFGVKGNFAYELEESEGIIEIPEIGLQLPVGYGVTLEDLETGPGFYPESGRPEQGNVSIAGHRTTYGAPFNQLGELEQGDEIFLSYQGEKYKYEVIEIFDTESNDWSVIENTSSPKLTLTTCHPPGSSERRLIVRGELVE